MKHNKKAFTLIELLVVVLIIGVLSALALPQYQRSVHRARLAENLTRAKAFRDAIDLYLLENPTTSDVNLADIYPDLMAGLTPGTMGVNNNYYLSAHGAYAARCSNSACSYSAFYTVNGNLVAEIGGYKPANGNWQLYCYYEDNLGKYLCNSIKDFGYDDVAEGF